MASRKRTVYGTSKPCQRCGRLVQFHRSRRCPDGEWVVAPRMLHVCPDGYRWDTTDKEWFELGDTARLAALPGGYRYEQREG